MTDRLVRAVELSLLYFVEVYPTIPIDIITSTRYDVDFCPEIPSVDVAVADPIDITLPSNQWAMLARIGLIRE
jgi:hypothetical protein